MTPQVHNMIKPHNSSIHCIHYDTKTYRVYHRTVPTLFLVISRFPEKLVTNLDSIIMPYPELLLKVRISLICKQNIEIDTNYNSAKYSG